MRYFSLFSGIGGFELGIQNAYESLCNAHGSKNGGSEEDSQREEGQRLLSKEGQNVGSTERQASECASNFSDKRPLCVGYSEIDPYAIKIYQSHFPNHKNYGDITKIEASLLPDFQLLVGGFPCQSFSIAGKRGGFEDTRGTMFFELARIIREKQPRLFLLENVKGLLSHDEGRTILTIISTLDELGYDLEWQVLNSKNHGVPQNRERVYIAGHLRGTHRPEVFPFGTDNQEHISKKIQQECASTLTCENAGGQNRRGNYIIHNVYGGFGEGVRKFHDYSPTIRTAAGGGHIPAVVDGMKIRRLTPIECERLQGFPDNWTENGLSNIIEVCVNINPAIEKQLLQLDTVSNITSDGSGMVIPISQSESKEPVSIVLHELLLEDGAINTINHGNAIAILFNRKRTSLNDSQLKESLTLGKTVDKSTYKLWKVSLVGHYEKEKLSTILTWINETMQSITSISARTDENIIGVIILLNSQEQNYSSGESLCLRMGNIEPISDTQRYKCLGNAVTTNVIQAIMERML